MRLLGMSQLKKKNTRAELTEEMGWRGGGFSVIFGEGRRNLMLGSRHLATEE
jgi:hypothetical protein